MLIGVIRNCVNELPPLCDAWELRADAFSSSLELELMVETIKNSGYPWILTCPGRELEEMVVKWRPTYCDLPIGTPYEQVKKIAASAQVILSYHNFNETPADLSALLLSMQHPAAKLHKIACRANSTLDMLRLMIFSKRNPDVSCIAMGELGSPCRVLGPIVGNTLNYTPVGDTDPRLGQIDARELHETYRFSKLGGETKIYALLGNPVTRSPGHIFHNQAFGDKNAVYIKLHLEREDLVPFWKLVPELPFSGFSVTMPFKEAVQPHLFSVEGEAFFIGAVNTVIVRPDGKFIGLNTDAPGALAAIQSKLGHIPNRIAVLGSGGAAKAIVYALAYQGAHIEIYSRNVAKAATLVRDSIHTTLRPLQELSDLSHLDLLINTLPPEVTLSQFGRPKAIMDVSTSLPDSPLIQWAQGENIPYITGYDMFVQQARLQQKAWGETAWR